MIPIFCQIFAGWPAHSPRVDWPRVWLSENRPVRPYWLVSSVKPNWWDGNAIRRRGRKIVSRSCWSPDAGLILPAVAVPSCQAQPSARSSWSICLSLPPQRLPAVAYVCFRDAVDVNRFTYNHWQCIFQDFEFGGVSRVSGEGGVNI